MKLSLLIIAAFITLGITSCQKGELNDPASVAVTGKWRWVKSVGGIGGLTLTPASTGNNLRQEYYNDNTFKTYKNDTLQSSGHYSITTNYPYTPTENVNVLNFEASRSAFVVRNDSLFFSDLFISDGFSSVYVKIK